MNVIEVAGLSKKFSDKAALRNISFTVPDTVRCVGFLGPNGSGKTTTIRILTGMLKATSGTARVAGVDVSANLASLRRRIGSVEQHPALVPWMTALEFMVFVGRLFGLSTEAAKTRGRDLLAQVGLADATNRKIGRYSGGMKKRLGVAQALMGNPEVLFLDEPVAEMDPVGRVEILHLIEELKNHVTIFVSSHILADIERTAEQIIILNAGEIVSISTMAQLRSEHQTLELLIEVASRQDELYGALRNGDVADVEAVAVSGEKLKVSPRNRSHFELQLQSYLRDHGYLLRHYQWVEPSLEEIFMKVVQQS